MYDHAIIGGGLAGILAGFRLADAGSNVVLLDNSVLAAKGSLGGFAKFSGAKFSLLPAGQGLIEPAGSLSNLKKAIAEVIAILGLKTENAQSSVDKSGDQHSRDGLLRAYDSIVLAPEEIDDLIRQNVSRLENKVTIVRSFVAKITKQGSSFTLIDQDGVVHAASSVLYAGGRTGAELLETVGAARQEGRGLDLGVRVEFEEKTALEGLRRLGPDAKILIGRCRTFCLNYPGRVYRYPYRDFSIPGGVVAEPDHTEANVGILARITGKEAALKVIIAHLSACAPGRFTDNPVITVGGLGDKTDVVNDVFGSEIAKDLADFMDQLESWEMAKWDMPHRIHFPLLDWHWGTFGIDGSHATTVNGLFVAGDSAGHARGLLQAAVSGWLAAGEMLS